MSVLSDVQIIDALISGHVVCRPLRAENIRGASIDLTLGEWFWRCDARRRGVFNPYDEEEIKRYFAGPFQAKPYADVYDKIGWQEPGWPAPGGRANPFDNDGGKTTSPFDGIPDDWPVIVLRPGERILAHTHEFVGIRSPGTSQIHARSSSGRVGIKVCDDAGLGDPGWLSRWTLEMRNDNREAIILPVGERLAQINFFETGPTRESYGTEQLYTSKYQQGDDVDEMVANWHPEDMLPRNYVDDRVQLGDTSRQAYDQAIDDLSSRSRREDRLRTDELRRRASATVLD
jgi:deoxycytidine triphosphate deaminase